MADAEKVKWSIVRQSEKEGSGADNVGHYRPL